MKMLRKMLGTQRGRGELLEMYMHRTNAKIKRIKELHRVKEWDWLYHRSVYSWAGHTYIRTHKRTYIHTHTYMHAYKHASMHACTPACIHALHAFTAL